MSAPLRSGLSPPHGDDDVGHESLGDPCSSARNLAEIHRAKNFLHHFVLAG
jgi:hypothetical protein